MTATTTTAAAAADLSREDWLTEAAQFIIDDLLIPNGALIEGATEFPQVRFAIAPTPRGAAAVCYKRAASEANVNEIVVSAKYDDSNTILFALVHELIHASDDCQSSHRKHFAKVAKAVGLPKPLTKLPDTVPPHLAEYFSTITDAIGTVPHAKVNYEKGRTTKPQTNRNIKIECTSCGWKANTSRTQVKAMIGGAEGKAQCPSCLELTLGAHGIDLD